MRIEQMPSAGMPQFNSSPASVKELEKNTPKPQEVMVSVGGEKIKLGEYPADSQAKVEDSVENINRELRMLETNLRFSVHRQTKQIMVKIIDTNTKEVIKEIPSEKILDMVAAMMERAGLLMDKRG